MYYAEYDRDGVRFQVLSENASSCITLIRKAVNAYCKKTGLNPRYMLEFANSENISPLKMTVGQVMVDYQEFLTK